MKLKDYSVAKRWKEFKMIPASAYDVFVLRYNDFSEACKSHLYRTYDNVAVFREFAKAEEHIQFILGFDSFKGLEIHDVDYIDDGFIYKASNYDGNNSAMFEIIPLKFMD